MKETVKRIKDYSIITARALLTFFLGLCIVLGSVVLLVLQILSWPFALIASKCTGATHRLHLVDEKHDD